MNSKEREASGTLTTHPNDSLNEPGKFSVPLNMGNLSNHPSKFSRSNWENPIELWECYFGFWLMIKGFSSYDKICNLKEKFQLNPREH